MSAGTILLIVGLCLIGLGVFLQCVLAGQKDFLEEYSRQINIQKKSLYEWEQSLRRLELHLMQLQDSLKEDRAKE